MRKEPEILYVIIVLLTLLHAGLMIFLFERWSDKIQLGFAQVLAEQAIVIPYEE